MAADENALITPENPIVSREYTYIGAHYFSGW